MNDIFQEYMTKRLGEIDLKQIKTRPGPVVTISRAAGCTSSSLAHKLTNRLNAIDNNAEWEVISKEILHESAERLQLHPEHLKKILKGGDKSFLNEILQAFLSRDYHLERKTINTIKDVIQRFAIEGHKVFIGRGAFIICKDLPDALHIRLDAPIDWRINKLMQSKNKNRNEATEMIKTIEADRRSYIKSLKGRAVNYEDFDLTINQSKYNSDQMAELIITALKMKNIVNTQRY